MSKHELAARPIYHHKASHYHAEAENDHQSDPRQHKCVVSADPLNKPIGSQPVKINSFGQVESNEPLAPQPYCSVMVTA